MKDIQALQRGLGEIALRIGRIGGPCSQAAGRDPGRADPGQFSQVTGGGLQMQIDLIEAQRAEGAAAAAADVPALPPTPGSLASLTLRNRLTRCCAATKQPQPMTDERGRAVYALMQS